VLTGYSFKRRDELPISAATSKESPADSFIKTSHHAHPGVAPLNAQDGIVSTNLDGDGIKLLSARASLSPENDGKASSPTPLPLRRIGLVGLVPTSDPTTAATTADPTPREQTAISGCGQDWSSGRKDIVSGSTRGMHTRHVSTSEESMDEGRQNSARAPYSYRGIPVAAMEKLRVWVDEEERSDGDESDAYSDSLDVVTTTRALPTRRVEFVMSPPKPKSLAQDNAQERLRTPNTSREEELSKWAYSARERENHARERRTAGRYTSTQGSAAGALGRSGQNSRKETGHTDGDAGYSACSGVSDPASRFFTADSRRSSVHEYMAVQDPARRRAVGPSARTPRLSVVSFFDNPIPMPQGPLLKGGKVRTRAESECQEVFERTLEHESSVDRFYPIPPGEAATKDYSAVLREQGITPFVMGWGTGLAAEGNVSIDELDADDEAEIDWKGGIKYFPRQWVPGSKERAWLVSRLCLRVCACEGKEIVSRP